MNSETAIYMKYEMCNRYYHNKQFNAEERNWVRNLEIHEFNHDNSFTLTK